MSHKIIYTEEAEQNILSIYNYIAVELQVPDIAKKQANRVMNAIAGLEELPLRNKLYQDEPWHSKGLRLLPIDNYLVFYLVLEREKTVAIVRVMYGKRNIDRQLLNTNYFE